MASSLGEQQLCTALSPACQLSGGPRGFAQCRRSRSRTTSPSSRDGQPSVHAPTAPTQTLPECTMHASTALPPRRDSLGRELCSLVVGVIAMEKKTSSKAMGKLLVRMRAYPQLTVFVLPEPELLQTDPDAWRPCDALISFFSTGFPLGKLHRYVQRVRPFEVNSLASQSLLLDRRRVYQRLQEAQIPVPPHIVCDHADAATTVEEYADYLVVNGVRLDKPFVEKPVDAENHNIHVYFRSDDGGGCQQLFRKSKDKSSDFFADRNTIRRDGCYIYEQFIATNGTDIKVYTVGQEYAHAEGRKSPVVDGKVQRNAHGKEIRCPIMLNPREKDIARRIVQFFGQSVCGFDVLRSHGESYVMDVNGWSFVKTSGQYCDDAAKLICDLMARGLGTPIVGPFAPPTPKSLKRKAPRDNSQPILRCVVAVVRNANRTPKRHFSRIVRHPALLSFCRSANRDPRHTLILKSKSALEAVLAVAQRLQGELAEGTGHAEEQDVPALQVCLERLVKVLTLWPIEGVNRRVEFWPRVWGAEGAVIEARMIVKWGAELTEEGRSNAEALGRRFRRELYSRSSKNAHDLISLHSSFHHNLKVYSADEGRVQTTAAAFTRGLLNLNGDLTPIMTSLVRKDTQVQNFLGSQPRRARAKAAPIDIPIVHRLPASEELEFEDREEVGSPMGLALTLEAVERAGKTPLSELYHAMLEYIGALQAAADARPAAGNLVEYGQEQAGAAQPRERAERCKTVSTRWLTLLHEFYLEQSQAFDVCALSRIYDSAKYDVSQNRGLATEQVERLYQVAQAIAVPSERVAEGQARASKFAKGIKACRPLLDKVADDFCIASGLEESAMGLSEVQHQPHGQDGADQDQNRVVVRSRYYFTSARLLHRLVNVFRYGAFGSISAASQHGQQREDGAGEAGQATQADAWDDFQRALDECPDINYLSHVVCRMYEHPDLDPSHPSRFFVAFHFSCGEHLPDLSGASDRQQHQLEKGVTSPLIPMRSPLGLHETLQFLRFPAECVETPNPIYKKHSP